MVLGLVAYVVFDFGGVVPRAQLVAMVVSLGLAVLVSHAVIRRNRSLALVSPLGATIALFLACVLIQVTPWPATVLQHLGCGTWGIRETLLSGDPLLSWPPDQQTVSLHPYLTRADLRLLVAGFILFVVCAQHFTSRSRVERLLLFVTLMGTCLGLLGIVQTVTGATGIYWEFQQDRPPLGGSFVHPGHYSDVLSLSVGCTLALILIRGLGQGDGHGPPRISLRTIDPLDALLLASLVLRMVAIALSQSRNGLISFLVAGVLTIVWLWRSGAAPSMGWRLLPLLVVAFLVTLLVGAQFVYGRFTQMERPMLGEALRWTIHKTAALAGLEHFPLLGAGLGTFEYTYAMHHEPTRGGYAANADNLYVELFFETGAIGCILMLCIAVLLARRMIRSIRSGDPVQRACAFGAFFGLLAVSVHSVTDFGLRIPAVGALSCVVAGLLVGTGTPDQTATPGRRLAAAVVSLLLVAGAGLSLLPAFRTYQAVPHWNHVEEFHQDQQNEGAWAMTADTLDSLVVHSREAARLEPGNVRAHVWEAYYRCYQLLEGERFDVPDPVGDEELHDIVQRLSRARRDCPTFGPVWSVLGQIQFARWNDPAGARWIERARELTPHNASIRLAGGVQAAKDGDDPVAVEQFRWAIVVGTPLQRIFQLLVVGQGREDLMQQVVWAERRWCQQTARLYRQRERPEDAEPLEERYFALTKELDREGTAPADILATLGHRALSQKQFEEAVDYFHRVLQADSMSLCRLQLVYALKALGRDDEARKHTRILGQYHRQNPAVQRLVESDP